MDEYGWVMTLSKEDLLDMLKYKQFCSLCPYRKKGRCPSGSSECNEYIKRWLNSQHL
ncbi:MAG: hypothetical protein K5662_05520 [Lachnospiraceae bacterium]|jgi:hypothetical protein|nr:hypothetical protein [Lachnospiraceae bacterium]